jgi:glycosyltransferase involved in cell wall biosynthesis
MAAMEAIAAGIPIISSDTGVVAEIISDKNQIFTPGNVQELCKSILHIIQNYSTCHNVTKIARERLLQKFPASRQAKELCDALNLLKNN